MSEMSSPTARRRDQLSQAVHEIVAARGLAAVSVREVAAAADVSIGTVQHYFATKDELLTGAFEVLVHRVTGRIAAAWPASPDPGPPESSPAAAAAPDLARRRIRAVLEQLLPLDDERRHEATVQLAFSAAAASSPRLAEVQRVTLERLVSALAEQVHELAPQEPPERTRIRARVLLACVDGLALHHASSGEGRDGVPALTAALEELLAGVIPEQAL